MMLTGRSRTKTVENLNFYLTVMLLRRWWLASVNTLGHKIDFIGTCIAESTAFFYYYPQSQYCMAKLKLNVLHRNPLPVWESI